MRMSRATREAIKTSAVLVLIILLVLIYMIYPLNKAKTYFARSDGREIHADTLPPNDLSAWADGGLSADSFRMETDGITNLAAVAVRPIELEPKGTVILIPEADESRDQFSGYVRHLLIGDPEVPGAAPDDQAFPDSALSFQSVYVVTYDQRASGLSSGEYHGDGQLEAADLQAAIADLSIHGRLFEPVTVAGFGLGGDAALLAAHEDSRIVAVVAVNPYLTTDRFIQSRIERQGGLWFPFRQTVLWWWYKVRSGYGETPRNADDLKPVACPTVIFRTPGTSDEVLHQLTQLSGGKLSVQDWPADSLKRVEALATGLRNLVATANPVTGEPRP